MDLFLHLQFNSVDPHVCFYDKTMLFYYCYSKVHLEVRNADNSRNSFIIRDCVSCPTFFVLFCFLFSYEHENFLSSHGKNCVGILTEMALNL